VTRLPLFAATGLHQRGLRPRHETERHAALKHKPDAYARLGDAHRTGAGTVRELERCGSWNGAGAGTVRGLERCGGCIAAHECRSPSDHLAGAPHLSVLPPKVGDDEKCGPVDR